LAIFGMSGSSLLKGKVYSIAGCATSQTLLDAGNKDHKTEIEDLCSQVLLRVSFFCSQKQWECSDNRLVRGTWGNTKKVMGNTWSCGALKILYWN